MPFLEWKWQKHNAALGRTRVRKSPLFPLARVVVECVQGRPRDAGYAGIDFMTEIAWRSGRVAGLAALYFGRRRPPRPMPLPKARDALVPPLMADPVAVIVGRDRRAIRFLTRGLRAGTELASPPPGLFEVRPWDQAPMWSRGLVRTARRMGWRLPPDIASRRVEWERPSTHGEAVLSLYRAFTWLHSKQGFVVASWDEGVANALIRHFPAAKIISTEERADVDLRLDLHDAHRSPHVTARHLSKLLELDDEEKLAAGLRLAALARWMR